MWVFNVKKFKKDFFLNFGLVAKIRTIPDPTGHEKKSSTSPKNPYCPAKNPSVGHLNIRHILAMKWKNLFVIFYLI